MTGRITFHTNPYIPNGGKVIYCLQNRVLTIVFYALILLICFKMTERYRSSLILLIFLCPTFSVKWWIQQPCLRKTALQAAE